MSECVASALPTGRVLWSILMLPSIEGVSSMTGYVKVHCTACEYFEGECTACEGTGEVIQHWDGVEKGYFVPQEVLAVEAVVLGKRQWIING